MAPILSFTAEEVWGYLAGHDRPESVHLAAFPEPAAGFPDQALLSKYEFLLGVRDTINREMDNARKNKTVSTAQEAKVILETRTAEDHEQLSAHREDLKILAQVADLEVIL